jgi:pSer/pThr/pTyr-binding forkhead associated (FHA) protein
VSEGYLTWQTDTGPRRVELDGPQLTLGRLDTNDIVFSTDDSVSRTHAVLRADTSGWVLEDSGSANGTFVNDTRTSGAHRLRDGDLIGIGRQRLVFSARAGGTPPPAAQVQSPPTAAVQLPASDAGYLDVGEEWSDDVSAPPPGVDRHEATRETPSTARPTPSTSEPARSGTPTPATSRQGRAHVVGVARSVDLRTVQGGSENGSQMLLFRVDQYDGSGNRLPAIAVQFAPLRQGQVSEGEEVSVSGTFKHGTLHADHVKNLSTGAELKGAAGWERGCGVVAIIMFFVVLAFIGLIAFLGISDSMRGP